MQLLSFKFGIHKFCFLGQGDGVQVEVAVENDRTAGESSSESAGEPAQKHILTCSANTQIFHVDEVLSGMIHTVSDDDDMLAQTCQVEVLQWSLRSHCSAEFRAESGDAMIRSIDFTFGGSDIVCVCDGGPGVNVLNLHKHKKQE